MRFAANVSYVPWTSRDLPPWKLCLPYHPIAAVIFYEWFFFPNSVGPLFSFFWFFCFWQTTVLRFLSVSVFVTVNVLFAVTEFLFHVIILTQLSSISESTTSIEVNCVFSFINNTSFGLISISWIKRIFCINFHRRFYSVKYFTIRWFGISIIRMDVVVSHTSDYFGPPPALCITFWVLMWNNVC